jgi:transposase
MRKGYPRELRTRALSCLSKGMSFRKVSELLNISVFALQNWKKQEALGDICPVREDVRRTPKHNHQAICDYIKQRPCAYLYEVAEVFGTVASVIHYVAKKNGLTYKKKSNLRRS